MPGLAFGTPFDEQIAFFRQKLNLPSERWDDIEGAAHDRVFIVAGAKEADLLNDLRAAVDKAVASGTGDQFHKDFMGIVRKHGWTGWTGEGTPAGEAWRSRVIYDTNLRTSYAAGRWRQLTDPAFMALAPYWKYVHADGVMHPRPMHKAWHGMVLPATHEFWRTHFPPNGWGCHCRVVPLDKHEYAQHVAAGGATEPPEGWQDISPKTGTVIGIDKGFDYAPGASVTKPLKSFIDAKLIALDAPIGARMYEAMAPVLAAEQQAAWSGMVTQAATTMRATGETQLAHTLSPATADALLAQGIAVANAAIWLRDTDLIHALRDAKAARGASLSVDTWLTLPAHLKAATPYLDTADPALIYVFDTDDGLGKVLVRINFSEKVRFGEDREKLVSNFIRTGGLIGVTNIGESRYLKLEK